MTVNENKSAVRENIIELVSEEEAKGRVQEIYQEVKSTREGELDEELSLSKLWLMFGNDPELLDIFWQHVDYGYNQGSLPFELKSKISLVVATILECEGCRFFHESALQRLDVDTEQIDAIEQLEIKEVGFSQTEEVILRFAQQATEDPYDISDKDLRLLRELGFSEQELLEIFDCIAFHVYTAYMQAMAGIVYPGMDREEWIQPIG